MINITNFKKDLTALSKKYKIYFDGIESICTYPPEYIETCGLGGVPITRLNVEQRLKLKCEFTIID